MDFTSVKRFRPQLILITSIVIFYAGCSEPQTAKEQDAGNATTSMHKFIDGNSRFAHLKPIHPDEDIRHLKGAAQEQHPYAVVVTCSDSRVAPELIFDQGIGDLFMIRNALGVSLIVIMGHENCGAVKAFVDGGEAHGHIRDIVDSLKREEEIKAIPPDDVNRLDDCVKANVLHGVTQLKTQSENIREKLDKGKLKIVGARYDLDEFKVEMLYNGN